MSYSIFVQFASVDGVRLHPGAGSELIERLEIAPGVQLPRDHKAALSECNGVQIYGGYFTLFSIGSSSIPDILNWNDPKIWKFAWESRCIDFWCFAESAWGDQYAYNISDLSNGVNNVYLLDCLSMTPTPVASNFSEFLEKEFFRSALEPYDIMIKEARQAFGDLEIGEHLIYVPSLLLGGKEEISSVRKMDARAAMICNGDIASQLDSGPRDGRVKSIIPYEDGEGRMRLELSWV